LRPVGGGSEETREDEDGDVQVERAACKRIKPFFRDGCAMAKMQAVEDGRRREDG